MFVPEHSNEPLSERQYKSGVFDAYYPSLDGDAMENNERLSAVEWERKLREEEISQRKSRTSRLKEEMEEDNDVSKHTLETRFGSFSGPGVVEPSDADKVHSDMSVKVTKENKENLRQAGIDVDELEEGDEIPMSGLNWS